MPDYLKEWPNESDEKKEALILQCHKANIAISMAIDNGLEGRRDLGLLKICIAIIGDRLKEAFESFKEIIEINESLKDAPRWTLLALGLVSSNSPPFDNVRSLLNTNNKLLQQVRITNNEAARLKNLMGMSHNFTEIQSHLRGERWPGPSRPRRKP